MGVVKRGVQPQQVGGEVGAQRVRGSPADPLRDPCFGDRDALGRAAPETMVRAARPSSVSIAPRCSGAVDEGAGDQRRRELHGNRGGEDGRQEEDLPPVRPKVAYEQTPVQAVRRGRVTTRSRSSRLRATRHRPGRLADGVTIDRAQGRSSPIGRGADDARPRDGTRQGCDRRDEPRRGGRCSSGVRGRSSLRTWKRTSGSGLTRVRVAWWQRIEVTLAGPGP